MATPTLDWAPPEAAQTDPADTWQPPEVAAEWTPPEAQAVEGDWMPPELEQSPVETGLRTIGQNVGRLSMTGVEGIGRWFENLSGVANQAVPGLGDVLDYAPQSALFQALKPVAKDLRQETEAVYKPDAQRNPIAATVGGGIGDAIGMIPMIATGGTPLVLGAAAASGFGEGSQTAEELGVQNPAGQMALGAGFGAAETLVERLGGIGAGPVRAAGQQAIRSLGGQTLRTIGSEAIEEPITGALQDVGSATAAATVQDPNRPGFTVTGQPIAPLLPNDPAYWERRGMEAIGGAAGGTVFAGLGLLANRGQPQAPAPEGTPTVEGDLPGVPQPTPGAGQVSIDGETYNFNPAQITADQVRTLAATGGLQEFLDQGMVRNAFAPPPTDTAPPVPAPADGGGVPGSVVAGAEPVVGAAGPTVQEAQETLGDLGNVGTRAAPASTVGRAGPAPLPRDADGNLDLLNYLNENPIRAPRRGTEGAAAAEYDWREAGDFDPTFRSRIMQEGAPNIDQRAQEAYDLGFIPAPTAEALAAGVRNVIAKRQQQRRQGPGQARVMSAMEKAQTRFENSQATLRIQGQGVNINLDEISPGDTLTIDGEQVTVADVEIDDMGRTTRALLSTPAGTVRVTPESGLRSDIPTVNDSLTAPRRSLADINADLAAWADQTIAQGQGQMSTGLDPTLLAAYGVKGAQLIAEGFTTFARWSTEMLRRFGEAVRRYLRDAWAAARKTSERGALDIGGSVTRMASDQGAAQNAEPSTGGLTESDVQYLEAVERGDTETAQRIVDEAAKAAGAGLPTPVGNEKLLDTPLYWRLQHPNFALNPDFKSSNQNNPDQQEKGLSVWESLQELMENQSGGLADYARGEVEVVAMFGEPVGVGLDGEPVIIPTAEAARFRHSNLDDWLKHDMMFSAKEMAKEAPLLESIGEFTNESWAWKRVPELNMEFDPVTYDDAGNIIPPSRRFDSGPDIRGDVSFESTRAANGAGFTNTTVVATRNDGSTVIFGELVDLAARAVQAGVSFARWSADMVRQFGQAVRHYLQGAWQAARKTSEVGAINLGARISARPPTMAEAMEDQTRESQFGERVQADERLTPGLRDAPVSTFAVQSQQGALDAANAIIRDNGLDRAAALFGNDASLPMPVRIAGLMQAALQYDARAALAMTRGDANASAAADAATAAAIEAKANLEIIGNETGRNLAMYNMWVRMSPDGQLRRLEREMTKVAKQDVAADVGTSVEEVQSIVNEEIANLDVEAIIEEAINEGASPRPVNLRTGESLIGRLLGGIETAARGISESVTVQRAVQAIDDVLKALSGKLFADPLLITPVGQAVLRLTRTFLLQGVKLSQAVADAIADVRTRLPIAPAQEQPLSRAVTNAVVKEIIRPILRKLAFDQNYDRREAVKDMLSIGIGVMEAGRLADAVIAKRPKLAKIAQDKVRQAVLRRLSDKPRAKSRRQKLPSVLDTLVLAAGGGFINERQFLDAWDQKHGLPKLDPADRQRLRKLAAEVNLLPEGILRQAAATKFLNEVALIKGIPATDMILAAWYANILSGLSTQGVNIWGNGLNLFFRTLTAGMASPADFSKLLSGLAAGVKPGLREAREVLRTGVLLKTLKMDDMQASSALEQMVMQGRPQNAGQWLAYLMSIGGLTRYAFRAMGAMDAVFWYSAQEGYAHLAASRNLRKAGGLKPGTPQFNAEFIRELGGDEKQFLADIDQARNELRAANAPVTISAVNRRAWEIRQQRRSANVQEASVRWADRLVFQNQPEGVGALITEAIKMLQNRRILGVPVFVPLVPFNRIVSNLFESGLDWAGVGILRGLVGSHLTEVGNKDRRLFDMVERRERFMAGVLGMSIAGTLLAAAMAVKDLDDEEVPFMIYGFGPPDKGKRDLMPKGWRMFSMKIGRNYVSYAETPMGALLGAVGGWLDSVRYGNKENKTLVERGTLAFNSALNAFTSMGALSSLKEVVDLTTGQSSVRGMQQTALSPIPGLVPGQGLMRDVAIVFDDTKISNAEVFGALVKDIPVLKSYGRPALNVLGEPTKVEGLPVVRRFANGQRPDDNIAFIQKHKLRISALPATIEIGRYLPKREAGALGLDESDQRRALGMVALENGVMTPEQQYKFTQRQGELIRESLKRLRTEFQAPPSPEMTSLLQKRLQAATEAARQTAMRELVAELR